MNIVEFLKGKKLNNGFSLVELLIGVAVLSILAGIAIPTFLGQREKAYLTTAKADGRNLSLEITTVYSGCSDSTGFSYPPNALEQTGSVLTIPIRKDGVRFVSGISGCGPDVDFGLSEGTSIVEYEVPEGSSFDWCFVIENNGQKAKYDKSGLVDSGDTVTCP